MTSYDSIGHRPTLSILPAQRNDPYRVHCSHCRRKIGTFASGYARGGPKMGVLCHPNVSDRPDCYKLVTLYNHEQPCQHGGCYEQEIVEEPKNGTKRTPRPRLQHQ